MFGIEKLKEVTTDVVKFIMKIGEARDAEGPKGKKISFAEAVGLGIFAVPKAMNYVNDGEAIRQELKDLSSEERAEWLEHLCVELDLENDKIENVVEKSLIALNAIGDAVEAGLEARNPEE